MKKRQIKKNSNTAKSLLMILDPKNYPEKVFTKNTDSEWDDHPKGLWEIWHRASYEYDEWDAKSAYESLRDHVFWELTIEDFDSEKGELTHVFSPNVRTAKKVFDLAKQLIEQVGDAA